jgi:drug/metabolite transporter (DMT)-like permease
MSLIGLTGFLGSLGWFWAYSLALVAYVKAVGQIESVVAVLLSLFVWRERAVLRQLPGMLLVLGGILLVLFGR